ncbi:PH domain-containing protein [Cellulomonas bogoriensis]|nr:PH domain-containing protein [Cellulomonas bogoriensis]
MSEPTPMPATPEQPWGAAPSPDPGAPTSTDRGGPFDPPGVPWQGVSPRLVTVRLIGAAVWLGLPLAGGVVAATLADVPALWLVPGVLGALVLWTVVVVPRQVRAIGYAERDDDLLIRRGVLFRSLVVVPYGRMQFVDVQAGPVDRWFGIARVQLHTASPTSDAVIPGLPPTEAARLRDRLAARGEAQLAGL